MRQKVAKALRKAARQFSVTNNRTVDVLSTIKHPPVIVLVGFKDEYDLNGKPIPIYSRVDPETHVFTDGPRYFYKQLKKGFMRGQLRRVA